MADRPFVPIPVREEFRVRRMWFYYHDIRAFTTSWLPLPLFLAYRVAISLYVFVSLVGHIAGRFPVLGFLWPILFTNISYFNLFLTTTALAFICSIYTLGHYKYPTWFLHYLPQIMEPESQELHQQDNLPPSVKVVWCMYVTAATAGLIALTGYWACFFALYDSEEVKMLLNGSNSSNISIILCNNPDIHSVQVHGMNGVVILLDIIFSRVPYQCLHFFYPSIYITGYVIFTIVYWAAGGVNHRGDPYVYDVLDYGNQPQDLGLAVIFILSGYFTFLVLFALARGRDQIHRLVDRHRTRSDADETCLDRAWLRMASVLRLEAKGKSKAEPKGRKEPKRQKEPPASESTSSWYFA